MPWQSPYNSMDGNPIILTDRPGTGVGDTDYWALDVTTPSGTKAQILSYEDYTEFGNLVSLTYNYGATTSVVESFSFSHSSHESPFLFEWNENLQAYYSKSEGLTYADFVHEYQANAGGKWWEYKLLKEIDASGTFAIEAFSDPTIIWEILNDEELNKPIGEVLKDMDSGDIILAVAGGAFSTYLNRYSKIAMNNRRIKQNLPVRKWGSPTKSDMTKTTDLRKKYGQADIPVGEKKNVAYADGKIGGDDVDLETVSGKNKKHKGNFEEAEGHYEGVLGYEGHTEQKIVDFLYKKYGNNKSVSGTIRIISDKKICTNCNDVIDQFQKDFPNIKIERVQIQN